MREELRILARKLIGAAAERKEKLCDDTVAEVFDNLADILLEVNREMEKRLLENELARRGLHNGHD